MSHSTRDLFTSPTGEAIPMPDAEVTLWPEVDLPRPPSECLAALIADTPWRQDRITLFGKSHLQPRLAAWYGDPGSRYTYSGLTLEPLSWTPLLCDLKTVVEEISDAQFNSVLLNYYRDNRDAMGMHADDEVELGPEPAIASLSLGETRTLVFKHRFDKSIETFRLPLPSASLLVMRGRTQACWKHGINRSAKTCGPRVNLTFRMIRQ